MTRVPLVYYGLLFVALAVANVQMYKNILATPALEVRILEAGKADKQRSATLITGPTGKRVLINAGADARIVRALGTALPHWERELDAVVLTSTSESAMGGLPDVLNRYQVATLVRPETEGPWSREAALAEAARTQSNIKIVRVSSETRLLLGGGASLLLTPSGTSLSATLSDGTVIK